MAKAGAKLQNKRKRKQVRNTGGRPPKPGERYRDGQPTRTEAARRAKEAEKETMSVALEQRQRHLSVSAEQARDQSAPLVSWRWLQSKQIQKHHHDAGVRFAELWFSYLRAIDDENSRLKRSSGGYVDPEEQAYIDRCKRVRAEFEAIRNELMLNDNHHRTRWWRAMVTISIENKEIHDLQGDFRQGANVVHRLLIAADRRAA